MDFMIIAFAVVLLLLIILLLAVGVYAFMRRRGAAEEKSKESKSDKKPKKIVKKRPSAMHQPQAKQPADNESAQSKPASSAGSTPAAPPAQTMASAQASASAHPAPLEEAHAGEGEKIRILIVDDNEGTRENVTRLLYFEDDLEVVGQAMNGRQGVEMAVEIKPHIVLMDINMPDMDGITATQEMGLQVPFSQVIIMSVQSDQHYMKRAMAAGARDFQPKPFTSDELVGCIRRVYGIGLPVYQQFEAAEQAKLAQKSRPTQNQTPGKDGAGTPVIAVFSPKGGVGTSAIASNLAVALQQELGEVVLMDGDLQFGDILVHLNTRATRTMIDLIHETGLEADLLAEILLPHSSGLKLLLAPPKPELADAVSSPMLTEIISELKKQSKVVVVDTYSTLTDETLTILDIADYILVVLVPELPAIKNVRSFLDLADELEFDPNRLKVIINKADEPGGVPPNKVEEVLKLQHTFHIPRDPRLEAALRKGVSVCLQDASAPSAVAITGMAQQIWQKLGQPEAEPVEAA